MKILFCNGDLALGGAQRRLSQLIIGLNNAGYNDIYCILTKKEIAYQEVLDAKVIFFFLTPNFSKYERLNEFSRLIKKISPDVVHCWSIQHAFFLNLIKPFSHFKYICGTIVSSYSFKPSQTGFYIEKLAFLLSDTIVSNSKAGLLAKNAPARKSHVIYNGFCYRRLDNISAPEILRSELSVKTPYLVSMAARVDIQKDIMMFVKVSEKLQEIRKDVTFLMVGEGNQLQYYMDYVKNRAISNIVFTGYRQDVVSILNCSDVCVLCSKYKEGVSNSILEALACGRPVVATSGGGTNEIVLDGFDGYLVNSGDVDTMVEKINLLLNDSKKRKQMGDNAIKLINKKFLLSTMVEQYIYLYNKN